MRVLSCEVTYFGSYESLNFDFTNQGLTLISGQTGAGKSTLCDAVPWVLFGVTAKNGAVDEVRSWGEKGPTTGQVLIKLPALGTLEVVRERATKNDLWFRVTPFGFHREEPDSPIRGKDIPDTQRQINEILGLSSESYLAAAYFHEFSQTASFFTAPAKTRRQITEQLVDLSKVKQLAETITEYRKELKKEQDEKQTQLIKIKANKEALNKTINSEEHKCLDWAIKFNQRTAFLKVKIAAFDSERDRAAAVLEADYTARLTALQFDLAVLEKELVPENLLIGRRQELVNRAESLKGQECMECGAPKNVSQLMVINKDIYKIDAELEANVKRQTQVKTLSQRLDLLVKTKDPKLEAERTRINTYGEQLEALRKEVNPHEAYKDSCYKELNALNAQDDTLQTSVEDLTQELDDTAVLLQVSQDLRGVLLNQAVSYLQDQTNKLLTDHFDAEIKCEFSIADADKLDVTIYKDGNICTYTQLSKGQRQLLRLTFGVAVMKCVANNSGVQISAIFMDEVFNGLDEDLKAKGYTLLEGLAAEYESVFVIDHSTELKAMFTNEFQVELVNGKSQIISA